MGRRTRRGSRRSGGTGGLTWMLVGLTLGLLVAAGVYLSDWRIPDVTPQRGPAPTMRADGGAPAAPAARGAEGPSPDGRADTAVPAGAGAAADTAPGAESRFDFYEILPQYEVIVPEVETVTTPRTPESVVTTPGRYILQTGSFRLHSDADRMQASLALLGIESAIQRVTIDDDVYHRVRVGPTTDLDQLNRVRAQLRDAGIDALTVKVNE